MARNEFDSADKASGAFESVHRKAEAQLATHFVVVGISEESFSITELNQTEASRDSDLFVG